MATIGITGATGNLGRFVVGYLKQKSSTDSFVALVRTPEKAKELGIEARYFDYTKPEVLVEALKGIDKLLLISGNQIGSRYEQHSNVVEAAKQAGVKEIVYTSLLNADTSSSFLAPEHLQTEKIIKESGIPYVILRNGWYSENYAASIPAALQTGAFIGSAKNGKISSSARKDYAEAATTVLTSEGHEGKTYELAGDNFYTLNDLAQEISKQTGKNISYRDVPEEEYYSILLDAGLPEGRAKLVSTSDTVASKGGLFDDSKQLSKLIGRPTTPMAETVKETLQH